MKVLILANFQLGIYRFRMEIIRGLKEKGHEVYLSVPPDAYTTEIEASGAKVIDDNYLQRRGMNPLSDIKLYKHYRRLINDIKPDAVLTFTVKPNVYGGYACQKSHIPYVSCVTGLGTAVENGGILQKITLTLTKIGLKGASRVFFENTSNRDYIVDHGIVNKERTVVVSGAGVNLEAHGYEDYPENEDPIILSMVGRVMKDKGIDEYLYAAEEIKKTRKDVVFRVVGDFDENYESIIKEKNDAGVIEYLGLVQDVHSIMKESHAIVHPSYHEGMSNVLLEGAAAGRPLIASNVPGCKEAYDEGVSGIGFDIKSGDALIKAIEQFLSLSHKEKEEMGIAGRRKMEKEFDRQKVVNKYIEELEKANGTV